MAEQRGERISPDQANRLALPPNDKLKMEGIELAGPLPSAYADILSIDALRFVAKLTRKFSTRRLGLLQRRINIQAKLHSGWRPGFLTGTEHIRRLDWQVTPLPADLQNRRVEVAEPASDARMLISALNSAANVFVADLEDRQRPTWDNTLLGQHNLRASIQRTLHCVPAEGKPYEVNHNTAVLMVRPRGWHLSESHVLIDRIPVPASLFDFGLYFYHNARNLLNQGTAPYYCLSTIENHLEVRLWNDVFLFAQHELGIPSGTIKATVFIESVFAIFEMDEILYELREHSGGLNYGRWDCIFQSVTKLVRDPQFVAPNPFLTAMAHGFFDSYVQLLIATCHRRGAHAMRGIPDFIPTQSAIDTNSSVRNNAPAHSTREEHVGQESARGAHPGLVPVARAAFDAINSQQVNANKTSEKCTEVDPLRAERGNITEDGLRMNVEIGIRHLEAWLRGTGVVPLCTLMDKAATEEIAQEQIWQWLKHRVMMSDKRPVTQQLVHQIVDHELETIRAHVGRDVSHNSRLKRAKDYLERIALNKEFVESLTLLAYYVP